MKTDGCRERRESLGAYALGHLSDEERAGLEAHLEGCPSCRAELEQLTAVVRPMSLADPARFESAPQLPASLGARVAAAIARERLGRRRKRLRLGLGLGGAAAAVATAIVLLALPGEEAAGPEQHVTFSSLPKKMKISAKLIPNAFGTEIHMYVKGVSSGTLCRVYLRSQDGRLLSAGTFRYRWGDDGSFPILSSALDLSKTDAMEVRVGDRSYFATVGNTDSETTSTPTREAPQ
jgi:Putative zinc-finger